MTDLHCLTVDHHPPAQCQPNARNDVEPTPTALSRTFMVERVLGVGLMARRFLVTTEDVAAAVSALGPIVRRDKAGGIASESDPSVIRVPVGDLAFALVDAEDYPLIRGYTWRLSTAGYATACDTSCGEKLCVYMHRAVMMTSATVDHRNQNKLDNRKSNLRRCSSGQNNQNTRLSKNNRSGIKGLSKSGSGWRSRVQAGVTRLDRWFPRRDDAIAWLISARRDLHGEFACHAASEDMRHLLEKHLDEGLDYFAVQGALLRDRMEGQPG